jgi:regulator of sigma E protease
MTALLFYGGWIASFLLVGLARFAFLRRGGPARLGEGFFVGRERWEGMSFQNKLVFVLVGPAGIYGVAAVVFLAGFLVGGETTTETTGRIEVAQGMPAAEAGLVNGDRIVSIDGEPVAAFIDVSEAVLRSYGEPIDVEVERNGERLHFQVTPSDRRIGVRQLTETRPFPLGKALIAAIVTPANVIRGSVGATWEHFVGTPKEELGGPTRMIARMGEPREPGPGEHLFMLGSLLVLSFYLTVPFALLSIPWRKKKKA